MIQRARNCTVTMDGAVVCSIERGILCYVAFDPTDKDGDADWIAHKALSIFYWPAEDGTPWKRGVVDIGGDVVVVVDEMLRADCDSASQPSLQTMPQPEPEAMYAKLIAKMEKGYSAEKIHATPFAGRKTLDFINDGPLTLNIDSHRRRD